jgi:hypothetical protein
MYIVILPSISRQYTIIYVIYDNYLRLIRKSNCFYIFFISDPIKLKNIHSELTRGILSINNL